MKPQPTTIEELRASVEQRIARLNPGQGGSAQRRKAAIRWAEVHIRQVLAEAEAVIRAMAEAQA